MAGALIDEFGSLLRVLGASQEAVSRVLGGDDNIYPLLAAVRETLAAATKPEVGDHPLVPTDPRVVRHYCASLAPLGYEVLVVLFLDRQHRLLKDEIVSTGSLTILSISPRTVLARALELRAAAIVLVHNHPGGNPRPSQSDIEATQEMRQLGLALEVELLDHIIVAGGMWMSMRKAGVL
jgi:DNA repair protein RadC